MAEPGPLDWLSKYELTDAEADELSDPNFIIPDLIIDGHIVAIVGKGGSGKSTVLQAMCPDMVREGYTVVYVHVDCPPGEAKRAREMAKASGYRLLTPDFKATGVSALHVLGELEKMNASGADLRNVVFVFDTLKKFTDLMSKAKAASFLALLGALRGKGMTSVLLGHVNKHPGHDGKDVFEGVGDLRNDIDELIYLDTLKNDDGSLTISTRPDKVRGEFHPLTFKVDQYRNVTKQEVVDVQRILRAREEREKDQPWIDACLEAMNNKMCSAADISKYASESHGMGDSRIRNTLRKYAKEGAGQLWYEQQAMRGKGLCNYSLTPFR